MHRQAVEPRARRSRRRGAQQRQDLVGARDHGGGHAFRIGAAAAGADIVCARDFRLDIAAQRPMRRDAGFDAGKPVGLGIEPMEIAVEHTSDRRALHRRQHVDCRKRSADCRRARRPHRAFRPRNPARARTRAANSDNRSGQTRPAAPSASAKRSASEGAFIPPLPSARRRSSSLARRCSRNNARQRGSGCPSCRRR